MGPQIQWVNSYVTADISIAFILRQMKKWFASTPSRAGSRQIQISKVSAVIDPATAE
jgi:hypothetical protein